MSIASLMPPNPLMLCCFLFLPSIFPSTRSLPLSQFFASVGQSIGVSVSASVLPMNVQDWFPFGWTGWISLQSKGLSRVFSNITVQKNQFFGTQLSLWSNSHIHTWLLEKTSASQFSRSVASDSLWPHGPKHARPPVYHQLPEFTQTHVHWVCDTIQPSHPLSSLLLLPSIFPQNRVFSNESLLCIRWPRSFSFSISPSNEYSGLTFFRMDWLDLLAVQGTLKRLHQHHSSKASVFWCSAFFIVQLSHPYMTTGKTITLTRWTSAGKVMSLLFNTLVLS